jgi:hypothetical protein
MVLGFETMGGEMRQVRAAFTTRKSRPAYRATMKSSMMPPASLTKNV